MKLETAARRCLKTFNDWELADMLSRAQESNGTFGPYLDDVEPLIREEAFKRVGNDESTSFESWGSLHRALVCP